MSNRLRATFAIHFSLLISISLIGCLLVGCSNGEKEKSPSAVDDGVTVTQANDESSGTVPITISIVKKVEISPTLSLSEVTRGINEAALTVRRSAEIRNALVSIGDRVSAGDTLVVFDSDVEELALQSAEAELSAAESSRKLAKLDFARARRKYEEKLIAESQRDRAEASYAQALARVKGATAALARARHNLKLMIVTSPIDGEVSRLPYELGETPPIGAVIAEVIDRSRIKLDLFISERDLGGIAVGSRVIASAPSIPEKTFDGRIRSISPKSNDRTRLFHAEAILDNPGLELRSGMTVDVAVSLNQLTKGLALPRDFILPNNDITTVALLRGGAAAFQQVTVSGTFENNVNITSGLIPGDTLIVSGIESLSKGSAPQIVGEVSFDSLFY